MAILDHFDVAPINPGTRSRAWLIMRESAVSGNDLSYSNRD